MLRDRVHDRELLDILEQIDSESYNEKAWRVVRSGLDPMRGSTANGRWGAAGEFEVLYTACNSQGALAEIGYRMGLEPIWPSKISHEAHTIEVSLDRVIDLSDFVVLERLGVQESVYEAHQYESAQAVSAAARFLEFQGMLVPNARYPGNNLVVFPDVDGVLAGLSQTSSQKVDWNAWRASNRQRPSRRR